MFAMSGPSKQRACLTSKGHVSLLEHWRLTEAIFLLPLIWTHLFVFQDINLETFPYLPRQNLFTFQSKDKASLSLFPDWSMGTLPTLCKFQVSNFRVPLLWCNQPHIHLNIWSSWYCPVGPGMWGTGARYFSGCFILT